MIKAEEDSRNEFKIKLTDKFENEVIAFLNSTGGNIYLGVDDKGIVTGLTGNLDLLQRKIKDRIKTNIMPSTIGLFQITILEEKFKKYIKVIVAGGNEKPYYLKGMGMSPDSCFIRVGSAIESMDINSIERCFSSRTKNTLKDIEAPMQDLEFSQLKIYYEEKGYDINSNFLKQLELYTSDKKYNYIAYLISDNNNISIQFAKYEGSTVKDLCENQDFGYCSLIKATKNILNKFQIENRKYTKIMYPEREEIEVFNFVAIREIVINAIIHNDWTNEYSPKFEIFDDRLEISSNGGIVSSLTEAEFLEGFSVPKNKELMRIFRDLDLVEQLGTGIKRTLEVYDKDIFHFYPNFIRVVLPFRNNEFVQNSSKTMLTDYDKVMETDLSIIKLILDKPDITQKQLADILGVSSRTIARHLKLLMEEKHIKRVGSDKKGTWSVLKKLDN